MTVLYGYCLQAIRDRCSSCFMLWPWIVAILQDHMISVQTHLLHVCLSMLKSFCVCCHLFLHSRSVAPASHVCRRPWPHHDAGPTLTLSLFQGDSGATHVLAWGISWLKQKFDHLALTLPPTPDASQISNAHAGSRARVTSMGGLYDAATLHALGNIAGQS